PPFFHLLPHLLMAAVTVVSRVPDLVPDGPSPRSRRPDRDWLLSATMARIRHRRLILRGGAALWPGEAVEGWEAMGQRCRPERGECRSAQPRGGSAASNSGSKSFNSRPPVCSTSRKAARASSSLQVSCAQASRSGGVLYLVQPLTSSGKAGWAVAR